MRPREPDGYPMLKPHDLRHSVALECLTNITHLEERGDARQAV